MYKINVQTPRKDWYIYAVAGHRKEAETFETILTNEGYTVFISHVSREGLPNDQEDEIRGRTEELRKRLGAKETGCAIARTGTKQTPSFGWEFSFLG